MNVKSMSRTPLRAAATLALAGLVVTACGAGPNPRAQPVQQRNSAATTDSTVDVRAMWEFLTTAPVADRDNIIVGLAPDVRADLSAMVEAAAAAAAFNR